MSYGPPDNALALCDQCGIEAVLHNGSETLAASRPTGKRRLPAPHLWESCVTDTVGDRLESHSKLGFETNIYFPVLDIRLLNELERRFTAIHCDLGYYVSNVA